MRYQQDSSSVSLANLQLRRYRLKDLLEQIRNWRSNADCAAVLDRALVVIDGPLGKESRPTKNRQVDTFCSTGGFRLRSQSFPIERSDPEKPNPFVDAAEDVISAFGSGSERPTVWMGGAGLPSDRLVLVETNPTPALALLMPMGNVDYLVTRAHHRLIDGDRVRAKSDWYWRCGANRIIAAALGSSVVAEERDHELVAALTCLAIGMQLDGQADDDSTAMAIGDANGIYVVPAQCHPDWEADLKGKVCFGKPDLADSTMTLHLCWDTPFREEELALRKQSDQKPETGDGTKRFPCPIAGCNKVFVNTRGGWDPHVGSGGRHPLWHPELTASVDRVRLFRLEFPSFFQ